MPLYVTIGLLTLKPGNRRAAEQPGFESVNFFLDEARNVYGAVSFWESQEAAEKADAILTPQFEQAFGDLLQDSIDSKIYEVYEHQR